MYFLKIGSIVDFEKSVREDFYLILFMISFDSFLKGGRRKRLYKKNIKIRKT